MSPDTLKQSAKFWFEDGSVILISTDHIGYKVHSGVLARHSQVFSDMLAFPQSSSTASQAEDCPSVEMSESADDLDYLLDIIYDGGALFYNPTNPLPFSMVSAMLELGTKFQIESIRAEALRRLETCFPSTLSAFHSGVTPEGISTHDSVQIASPSPIKLLQREDAIDVVNLARKFELTSLLPSAFYICAQLLLHDLLHGVTDACGRVRTLSAADLELCLKVRDVLIQERAGQWMGFLLTIDLPHESCTDRLQCSMLRHCWMLEVSTGNPTTLGVNALLCWECALGGIGFCERCCVDAVAEYRHRREETWARLGKVVGVVPWPPQEET